MASEAVRVIVRCRPENSREKSLKCKNVIQVDEERNQIILKNTTTGKPDKPFTFDGSYGSSSKTSTIYAESAAALVESVIEGFNATVFAYGQTGCGKSYTMEGPDSDQPIDQNEMAGIIPRACADLFDSVALSDSGKKFLVHASYLEIYNENVRDLLSSKTDGVKHLDLKEHPDRGVYVKGLSMHRITSAKQAQKLMAKGWSQRATGETLMNQDSSRSHAIFTIYVETEENDNIRAGKLHLVDLAGSERQSKTKASGQRLKEAAKINLSLSALGNVISALVDGKSKHIPYRDSKLTRILQDSLGGNTKTLMIACISPADNNYEETLSTLRYADRAKQIKNAPRINEDPKDALLRQYADEIQQLKELLNSQLGVDGLKQLIAAQKSGEKVHLPEIHKSITAGSTESLISNADSEAERLKSELAKAVERANREASKRAELEHELTIIKSSSSTRMLRMDSNDSLRKHKSQASKTHSHSLSRTSSKDSLNIVRKSSLASSVETSDGHASGATSERNSTSLQPASAAHEKQLARLMELQRGFVRSTHIDTESLEHIKRKKRVIKSKQAAAEKRRALAKKAVEAQNDEEMFQALFEGVHEDVRFQKGQVDRAKEVIGRLKDEIKDNEAGFEHEKTKLQQQIFEQEKTIRLLSAILDKVQPTIKRDCNYSNIDRIKKQAIYDDDAGDWILPNLMLMSQQQAPPPAPMSQKGQLTSRQSHLLNRSSSILTNTGQNENQQHPRNLSSLKPRRLQPLGRMDDDF